MSRPVAADIDPTALRHNLHRVRQLAPGAKVMAVIKADAYGHGLHTAADALADAEAFGVAGIDEALALRRHGLRQEICLLTGFHRSTELPLLAAHELAPVIHNPVQLAALLDATLERPLRIWIKVDTGMHRIGFSPRELPGVLDQLRNAPQVRALRVMSHLANADDTGDPYSDEQIRLFEHCTRGLDLPRSLANSAAVAAWPDAHFDWLRPGIMLYGASPLTDRAAADLALRPAMNLVSELIAVRRLAKGDPVGYGGIYRCPQDMPVGVVACGYGDGYPRHAPAGTPVRVNGQLAPLAGRVSMDMLTVDLRGHPGARIGDPVQLWGDRVPVDDVARAAGTIAYELLCGVSARVPRRILV